MPHFDCALCLRPAHSAAGLSLTEPARRGFVLRRPSLTLLLPRVLFFNPGGFELKSKKPRKQPLPDMFTVLTEALASPHSPP